jgi:hypothetical protein
VILTVVYFVISGPSRQGRGRGIKGRRLAGSGAWSIGCRIEDQVGPQPK